MKRIKTFGLAALMAFALTAIAGAGTALATEFRAEEYPTTLNGTQSGSYTLKLPKSSLSCSTVKMTGTLAAASSSVSLTPELKGCAWGFVATGAKVNGCKLMLNSTNDVTPLTGTMDISCNKEGEAIEFAVFSCTLKIPAQKELTVGFANSDFVVRSRNRKITETINATGVKYAVTGPEYCPDFGAHEDGSLTGTSVISGYNTPAEHAVGVYLADEQVEAPPLFSTEGGPSGVTSENKAISMSFAGMSPNCTSFQVGASLPFANDKLNLNVYEWKGCYYGSGFSVNTNGCSLIFQATTSEGEEAWGVLNIECPVGKSITFTAMSGQCNVSIPAQTDRAKLTFETVGTGEERKVSTQVAVTGLKYTGTGGFGFCNTGTQENGSLSSSFNLSSGGEGFFVAY